MNKFYQYVCNRLSISIAFLTVVFSIFFSILPFKSHIELWPLITPIIIYYWSIYKPESLSFPSIMLLGFLKDILENNILGISAIWFILFRAMIHFQQKYIASNSFIVVWAGFIFFLSIILFLPLALLHFSDDSHTLKITVIFSQWIITCFAYVPVHWLLNKLATHSK